MKNTQIKAAEFLGIVNYEQGIMRVPAQSKELMDMIGDRKFSETPKNEASTLELLDAWIKGWDKANLNSN